MAKKKDRAWFTWPHWNEIASVVPNKSLSTKISAALKNGQPLARFTIRKALLAARPASRMPFNIDNYVMDQRPAR